MLQEACGATVMDPRGGIAPVRRERVGGVGAQVVGHVGVNGMSCCCGVATSLASATMPPTKKLRSRTGFNLSAPRLPRSATKHFLGQNLRSEPLGRSRQNLRGGTLGHKLREMKLLMLNIEMLPTPVRTRSLTTTILQITKRRKAI